MARWENMPSLREVIRLSYAMVDLYCASYPHPPRAVTLDVDDTVDVVHGYQQMSLFNAHYDERCFQPIDVDDTATARPVAFLLRPGKTPSGAEIRGHLRRLIRRLRQHWPHSRITETATRVRVAFASACPEAILFRTIAHGVPIAGP